LGTDLHDLPGRFVRGDHWEGSAELALPYLEVGVAEACCVDLDEEFIVAALRDGSRAQLVGFVELFEVNFHDK
jgi:hypothetical protein